MLYLIGLDWFLLVWYGFGRTGQGCTLFGSFGCVWTLLEWVGLELDWSEFDFAGLEWIGLDLT